MSSTIVIVNLNETCAADHDLSSAPTRLHDATFWLLGRVSTVAQRRTVDRMTAAGLKRGYYGVLATLEQFGPSTQADIGRRLRVDRSDMTAMIAGLERDGWIDRRRDPADGRRNEVRLTRSGRAALTRLDKAIAAAEEEVFGALSATERQRLNRALRTVLGLTGGAPGAESR